MSSISIVCYRIVHEDENNDMTWYDIAVGKNRKISTLSNENSPPPVRLLFVSHAITCTETLAPLVSYTRYAPCLSVPFSLSLSLFFSPSLLFVFLPLPFPHFCLLSSSLHFFSPPFSLPLPPLNLFLPHLDGVIPVKASCQLHPLWELESHSGHVISWFRFWWKGFPQTLERWLPFVDK